MSYVDKELQKIEAYSNCAAFDPHPPPPSNQPHGVEDCLHKENTQTWTAVSTKRSATPPSHFSDQQTRDLLDDSSAVVSKRSAVEQDLDELGIYREADVDPSKVQHSYGLHPSFETNHQNSPEIGDSDDQSAVDDRVHDFSEFLAEHVHASSRGSSPANKETEESEEDDDPPVTKATQSGGIRKRKSSGKHADNGGIEKLAARAFRERTARQAMPFKMDRVQHSNARRGIIKTESDLEEEVYEQIHATKKKPRQIISEESKKKPKKSTRRPLAERKNLPSPTPTPSAFTDTNEQLYPEPEQDPNVFQTIIRTRLKGFGKSHLPIMLPSPRSTATLFETIRQKWRAGLRDRDIHYCIVSFPWLAALGEDEDMVMFGEDDDGVYNCMLKKIREARSLEGVGRCEIDLMIYPDEEK